MREELSKENGKTIFACGGSIPVSQPGTDTSEPQGQNTQASRPATTETEPITIRWDPPAADELARHAKLVLPLEDRTKDNLGRLLRDTDPASFGYQGKTTYDETYRKAFKMDTTAFATTFDPHALGIIDTIAQVLLPTMRESKVYRAVKAELYKLNIYSAPSGKFKAHVDTPRSNGQFGSLVVGLSLAHEGGQLQVRHSGREFTFDWGASTNAIAWAAFYSDCEHEVLEVTSGHRITLTYNLYAVRGNGTLAGAPSPSLDIGQLPLYQSLRDVCGSEDFLPKGEFPSTSPFFFVFSFISELDTDEEATPGGYLGFYCSHAYPHTSSEAVIVPDMLKSLDLMVLEAFRRLKIEARVRPVLETEDWYGRKAKYVGQEVGARMENIGSGAYEDGPDELIEDLCAGEGELDGNRVYWVNEPRHKQVQISYIAVSAPQKDLDAGHTFFWY